MAISPGELVERIRTATGPGLRMTSGAGNRLFVQGESSAQWMLGKKTVSFEAILKLDELSSTLIYWEMLSERSLGLAAGFFMSKFSQKGTERTESGSGTMPSGESYAYDFGSYRERMRKLAGDAGWQFKTVLMKPKD